MTYTPTSAATFRVMGGTLATKLGAEFTKIATETNTNVKVAKGNLTAGNANAFAFAWQNPESSKIIVSRIILRITTAGGTASSVLDAGPGASATTHSATLINGLDINQTGIFDNVTNKGSSGLAIGCVLDEKDGTTDYITGQILTQNAGSLAGKYYIYYTIV
jgi:hypothetical protein